jgi:hypothetical protein
MSGAGRAYLRRRRRFSAEFKEVALEAIKGHETVAERRPSTNCIRPKNRWFVA